MTFTARIGFELAKKTKSTDFLLDLWNARKKSKQLENKW